MIFQDLKEILEAMIFWHYKILGNLVWKPKTTYICMSAFRLQGY